MTQNITPLLGSTCLGAQTPIGRDHVVDLIVGHSGHKSLNEVARYTRAADQARMVRNAVARMKQQHELANPAAESGKPGKKNR